MRFIGGLFYNFYSKYFPNVAIVLLLLTLYRIFRKRVRLVTRTSKLFYLDKKDLLMSPRSRRPLLVIAVAILVILLVPWTRRKVRAPIVLQPQTEVRLEAPEDAIVAEVLAGEGDAVRAGQPIFRLASPESRARTIELQTEKERLEREMNGAGQTGDAAGFFEAQRRRAVVEAAISSDVARRERLIVRSPIDGRILTPRLEDLRGRSVAAGTTLAEVGDCRTLRGDVAVPERRLDDLAPGAPVIAMIPGRVPFAVRGHIASISAATLGQPSTVTTGDPNYPTGRPDQFVARVLFENSDGSLRPGMAGRAKIYSKRASPVANVWRVLRRWIQTVVW
jgi:putative peptide zinc metalloprotease protein